MNLAKHTALGVLVYTMALAGCAPTKIHLHTKYVDEERVAQVTEALESSGFEVVLRTNHHPSALLGSILIYQPGVHMDRHLSRVQDVILKSGFSLNGTYPAEVSGHRYTDGNMGLYLVGSDLVSVDWNAPEDDAIEFAITDFELKSTDCENQFSLRFREAGELVLEEAASDTRAQKRLRWAQEGKSTIAVFDQQERYKFRYLRYQREKEREGKMLRNYFVELEPQGFYPLPYACSFRAKLSALLY